jgi:hypothetical protein
MVSVYLDYANPKGAPEGWHACAQFALAISNPYDPSIYTVSRESFGQRDCGSFAHDYRAENPLRYGMP